MSERAAEPTHIDALLEPSLSHTQAYVPPYSVRAGFFVAFFGGVYATLAFSAVSSRRLGRLRSDAWLYLLLALAWTGLVFWFGYTHGPRGLPSWWAMLTVSRGEGAEGMRVARYVSRACSLAAFGLSYLRLRQFYKAASLAGDAPPNPWKAAVGCALVGGVLTFAVLALGESLAPVVR